MYPDRQAVECDAVGMQVAAPTVAPLRLGVIGAGIAGLHHARAASALGHRVVKASTRSEGSERWKAFKAAMPDALFAAEPAQLLDDPDVDVLVVALPWQVMPAWLDRLIVCPKRILLEKPIALMASAIETALTHPGARSQNKLVGFNRRYYETAARLRARIAMGGLKAAQVMVSESLDRHVQNHGLAVLPHLLTFSSAHTLDLALSLLGHLAVIKLYGYREKHRPFVSLNGLLETADGIPVWMSLNADNAVDAGLHLLFDDRTYWRLSPLETLTIFDGYDILPPEPQSQIRRYRPHARDVFREPALHKPGFLQQMQAFLANDFGPGARIADALATQRFIEELTIRCGQSVP